MGTSIFTAFAAYAFSLNDGAASAGGAGFVLPAGVVDAVDQTTGRIGMPVGGAIFGISIQTGVAAGDTATFQVTVNGANVALLLGGSNATPRATSAVAVPIAFNAGDEIGVHYATTTGGAYTVNDLSCQVLVGFDIPTPVGSRNL